MGWNGRSRWGEGVRFGLVWYGMVEVCEGAPVAVSGWVLADRHDVRPYAASSLLRVTISVSNIIGGTGTGLLRLTCLSVKPDSKLCLHINSVHVVSRQPNHCHSLRTVTDIYHAIPYHTPAQPLRAK